MLLLVGGGCDEKLCVVWCSLVVVAGAHEATQIREHPTKMQVPWTLCPFSHQDVNKGADVDCTAIGKDISYSGVTSDLTVFEFGE